MILYHASTQYHALCCIVHKLVYHKKEDAVLMLVEYMYPKEEMKCFIDKLYKYGWFQEIVVVPENEFALKRGKKLTLKSTEQDIVSVLKNISSVVEKWYKPGFSRFKEINIAGDQWSVPNYLLFHQYPQNYFEDGSGLLGDTERYLRVIRDLNISNYVLLEYLNGAGRSSMVQKKFCDMDNQPKGFYDRKAVDFSIYKHLKNDIAEEVEKLLRLYGGKPYSFQKEEKVAVFLSQFLRTLKIQNLNVQKYITQLLADYFCEGYVLLVKPHPKDRWIDYKKILPSCRVLQREVPSELLPFAFDRNIDLVITASSTSIGGLTYIADDTISFGTDIEGNFERLHSMYVISRIIEKIYSGQRIVIDEIQGKYLYHFLKSHQVLLQEEGAQSEDVLYIEDGMAQFLDDEMEDVCQTWNNNDVAFFLCDNQKYEFLLNKKITNKNFIIITIEIEAAEKTDREISTKEIWIYSKNAKLREVVKMHQENYVLEQSGLEVKVHAKEANEMLIMEGKMKAMQYVLRKKDNEEKDKLLRQMKSLLTMYEKETSALNISMAVDGNFRF